MAKWQIIYHRRAEKVLNRLPADLYMRVVAATQALATDPFPVGSKKLVNTDDQYRIRVGDWRIVYTIKHDKLIILVVRIAPRGSAYRNF